MCSPNFGFEPVDSNDKWFSFTDWYNGAAKKQSKLHAKKHLSLY